MLQDLVVYRISDNAWLATQGMQSGLPRMQPQMQYMQPLARGSQPSSPSPPPRGVKVKAMMHSMAMNFNLREEAGLEGLRKDLGIYFAVDGSKLTVECVHALFFVPTCNVCCKFVFCQCAR